MKALGYIKATVVAVVFCTSTGSYALSPAASAAAIAAGRVIYNNNTPASSLIVYRGFRQLCKAGTIDTYTANSVKAAIKPGDDAWGAYAAFSCTLKPSTDTIWSTLKLTVPTWAGQDVFYAHTVDGGSLYSVIGMDSNPAYQKPFLGVVAAATLSGCVATGYVTSIDGDPIWGSCATVVRQGQGGFGDTDRELSYATTANMPLTIDITKGSRRYVNVIQGFGIAVSKPLYEALQVDQNLIGGSNNCVLSDQRAACQPTINKIAMTSILKSSGSSPTKTDWSWLTASGTGKNVTVCNHKDTSGTQTASANYFLGSPCLGNPDRSGAMIPASIANGDVSSNFLISESDDARDCLNASTDSSGGSNWAVGPLTLTRTLRSSDTFRFVKMNNIAAYDAADGGGKANVSALASSGYDFGYQLGLYWQTPITPTPVSQIMADIAVVLGDTRFLTSLNAPGVVRVVDMYQKASQNGNSCTPLSF